MEKAPNVSIGKAFEGLFDFLAGIKRVLHIPQHVETKFRGKGEVYVTGTAWPDRVCAIQSLMFVLDLKSTANKKSVDLSAAPDAQTRIRKAKQFIKLQTCWEHGVVSFYLIEWRERDDIRMYLVDSKASWPFKCYYDNGIPLGSPSDDIWFDTMVNGVLRMYGQT